MSDDRWVVLGLGHPRAEWFSKLSRWSTAAAIPVDFIKCVSKDEVLARLNGGRSYSALLVGDDIVGLDRDLIDSVRIASATVIVVGSTFERDWNELGVATHLPEEFGRSDLLGALTDHAAPIANIAAVNRRLPDPSGINVAWSTDCHHGTGRNRIIGCGDGGGPIVRQRAKQPLDGVAGRPSPQRRAGNAPRRTRSHPRCAGIR